MTWLLSWLLTWLLSWLVLSATPLLAGNAQLGEVLYQRYCSGCHGADGRGGGKGFMPHVGALTRKGYIDLIDDASLAMVIAEGGEAMGKGGFMPSWKATLSKDDIGDVIAYIRTLPPVGWPSMKNRPNDPNGNESAGKHTQKEHLERTLRKNA